jgi:hypothetical protein
LRDLPAKRSNHLGVLTLGDARLKKFGMAGFAEYASFSFKLLAITLLLVKAPWAWSDVFTPDDNRIYAVGYAVIFWMTIVCFGIIPFLGNGYIRILFVTLIISAYAIDQMFLDITGTHLELSMVRLVWLERRSGFEGLSWYVMSLDVETAMERHSAIRACYYLNYYPVHERRNAIFPTSVLITDNVCNDRQYKLAYEHDHRN